MNLRAFRMNAKFIYSKVLDLSGLFFCTYLLNILNSSRLLEFLEFSHLLSYSYRLYCLIQSTYLLLN